MIVTSLYLYSILILWHFSIPNSLSREEKYQNVETCSQEMMKNLEREELSFQEETWLWFCRKSNVKNEVWLWPWRKKRSGLKKVFGRQLQLFILYPLFRKVVVRKFNKEKQNYLPIWSKHSMSHSYNSYILKACFSPKKVVVCKLDQLRELALNKKHCQKCVGNQKPHRKFWGQACNPQNEDR